MDIEARLSALVENVDTEIVQACQRFEKISFNNHGKVLQAFREARVSDYHLKGGTGYGYNDPGRESLENVYSRIFNTEAALVRSQIVSGTHAIALCLFGVLRPGDELLAVQGRPYDTLESIIGLPGDGKGSLGDYGVVYRQVEPLPDGQPDFMAIKKAINKKTRMIMLQRSRGYSLKPSLNIQDMSLLIAFIRSCKDDVVVFVDNCYGEFAEELEPTDIGADIIAGSLIKNPGGGLVPTGGYVAGKKELVELAAARWTAPGIGSEVGPAPDFIRLMFQGIFLAPSIVAGALQGAVFTACLFERLGFSTSPFYSEPRTDIIQSIMLGSTERLVAFCRGIQSASPVDAHVRPEPGAMPGYTDPVIMAAGTFIQGASLELSADAPLREPYAVFMQGGLSRHYTRLAAINAARHVLACV
jgi:cystathionine beta-lyase family protein involved in aluminum resistance